LHLVGILFPHINEDARSKSHQIRIYVYDGSHDSLLSIVTRLRAGKIRVWIRARTRIF